MDESKLRRGGRGGEYVDFGIWISEFGFPIPDFRISDFRISDFGISDFGISDFGIS